MTLVDLVAADLAGATQRWRQRASGEATFPAVGWLKEDTGPDVEGLVGTVIEARAQGGDGRPLAGSPIAMVTKSPHGNAEAPLLALLARCAAFGLQVYRVQDVRYEEADRVAQILYTDAWVYFHAAPRSRHLWELIDQQFATPMFETVFGTAFDRSIVKPAATVIRETGVAPDTLNKIWQGGRAVAQREPFARQYGEAAAAAVFGGEDLYNWYRGRWPVGIHRIAPSVLGFAMRHEQLYDGAPVVVVNGHFLSLADLFARTPETRRCTVAIFGLAGGGPSVSDVRAWLIGDRDAPVECAPGSVRRDALERAFPLAEPTDVTPWANLIHCSDGYLAGTLETARLLREPPQGAFYQRLLDRGYDPEELAAFVLSDTVVRTDVDLGHLTRQTKGQNLDQSLATIERYFPPTFGAANAFGGGLSVERFSNAQRRLLDDPETTRIDTERQRRPLAGTLELSELAAYAVAGRAAILAGAIAAAVPGAGTGGRFGGYDVPEGDPKRNKALLPLFTIDGEPVSAAEIRMRNVGFWRAQGARLPVAFTTARATNASVTRWLAESGYDVDVDVAEQVGMFRWSHDKLVEGSLVGPGSAVGDDFLLREGIGTLLTKPAGTLGLIAAFLFAGVLDRWEAQGVRYVWFANTDDVAARLEPSVVGLLDARPEADAVVLCIDPPSADTTGGYLQETEVTPGAWRVTVSERDPLPDAELFSTNQLYLRLESILRLVRTADGGPAAIRELRDRLPLYVERKTVAADDGEAYRAVQIFQPLAALLEALPVVLPVRIPRIPEPGQRTSYAPLKKRTDVELAQAHLNALTNDDL